MRHDQVLHSHASIRETSPLPRWSWTPDNKESRVPSKQVHFHHNGIEALEVEKWTGPSTHRPPPPPSSSSPPPTLLPLLPPLVFGSSFAHYCPVNEHATIGPIFHSLLHGISISVVDSHLAYWGDNRKRSGKSRFKSFNDAIVIKLSPGVRV